MTHNWRPHAEHARARGRADALAVPRRGRRWPAAVCLAAAAAASLILAACEGITYPSRPRYCAWVDTTGWVIAPNGDTTGVFIRHRVAGCERAYSPYNWGRPDSIDVEPPQ